MQDYDIFTFLSLGNVKEFKRKASIQYSHTVISWLRGKTKRERLLSASRVVHHQI